LKKEAARVATGKAVPGSGTASAEAQCRLPGESPGFVCRALNTWATWMCAFPIPTEPAGGSNL
jgi:hypothetical protein